MEKSIAYAEVYEILSYMDKTTVMKIPIDILKLFKEKRDKNYISKINPEDIFNSDNVSQLTISIIAWLDLKYWATDDEKKILKQRYIENEKKHDEENKIKYNNFENVKSEKKKNNNINNNEIIIIEETNIFIKILNKIKLFFKF